MINYYVVLEIPNFSDEKTIRKAYRTLSKKYHPDVNSDPFATEYFLKVQEAYNFLMDTNKRLLLHQFLQSNPNPKRQTARSSNYQQPNNNNQPKSETSFQTSSKEIKPFIHFFSADKKVFRVNDRIFLQWNVSQCKSVAINFIGNVAFAGTHYLHVDHFTETIEVLMTVVGLDDKIYKYRILLKYDQSNRAEVEMQRMKVQYPDLDQVHFLKEGFFGMNARLGSNEFKNRMIALGILFLMLLITLISLQGNFFVLVLTLPILWLLFSQCYKRLHDTKKYKNDVHLLFFPIYNLFIIYELFKLPSEPQTNQFGLVPKQEKKTFKSWIQSVVKEAELWQKLSFGSFVLLLMALAFKSIRSYDEVTVDLTSYFVESDRPQRNGSINKKYFVVFNDAFSVEVKENDFDQIIQKKKYDTYKLGLNNKKGLEYIHLIDSKNNEVNQVNFGVLQRNNPLLLFIAMLFLSHIYVSQNLTAPAEKGFAKGYMIFCMMIYFIAVFSIIF